MTISPYRDDQGVTVRAIILNIMGCLNKLFNKIMSWHDSCYYYYQFILNWL
ncbi:hypothetical protein MBAV_001767 [Candidatus Magnetobacterium bavaricum]|uniref:Uncharacterized protein n=1 Tax=Candidatus Magnetobacterium bavaricum TaxID=29290 RepID=A0A0F3GZB7_9BACT|nr:hypothetical protein MBAV_001767 [Candidatus Magnetobacterium bavaricum]